MIKYKLDKGEIVNRLKQYPEVKAVKFECPDEVYEECEGSLGVLYETDKDIDVSEKDDQIQEILNDLLNPEGIDSYLVVIVDTDTELFYENPYNYEIREVK